MIGLDIVSERINRTRLSTSEKFGVKPTITILSEGKLDYFLLKDVIGKNNHSQNVILDYISGGTSKKHVIERVNRGDFDYGIVDMDYDFSDELATSTKIITTKGSCCTFGMVSSLIDFEIIREFTIRATNHDNNVKEWLNYCRNNTYKNGKKICEYIKDSAQNATIVRLFAGWIGANKSTLYLPGGLHKVWLKNHFAENIEFSEWCESKLGDLGDELLQEFRKFKSKFDESIHGCGINDHDFIQALEILITKRYGEIFDEGRFQQEIKNKIRVRKTDMPKSFKSKLKQNKLL